jgi:hypothetical protein
MTTEKEDKLAGARENAKGWLASIEEMLEAKWEKAADDEGWKPFQDEFGVACWRDKEGVTFAGTAEQLCEYHGIEPTSRNEDEARQAIEESVLSVMVRDGWRSPGQSTSEDGPEEYEILLSTGGPALRIYGKLDRHSQPDTAELQMQDWFTPWTRYPASEETLLAFASVFWFGE